jgi:chromosome segregation ATPase
MPLHSSSHFYANWAKERIDEIDATLASLESKASEVKADARAKTNQVLADLRKKRDAFRDTVKKQAKSDEAAWVHAKGRLETDWTAFEAEVQRYIETLGKQAEQGQAVFQARTAASGAQGRNRRNREAYESRCHSGTREIREAEPSGERVLVRPKCRVSRNTPRIRSS